MNDPFNGRGARNNPANRFLPLELVPDPEIAPEDIPAPGTLFLKDATRSFIT